MKNNGHILLHRKFRDWEWYTDINVKTLFIELLFQANWKDNKWKGILIKRGSLLTSLNSLSASTGLTVKQIRTCLDKLQRTNEVASKSTNRYRIITVLNYDKYQTKGKQDGNPKGSQGATLEELKEIYKLYNVKFNKRVSYKTKDNIALINARLKEHNYTIEDFKYVMDVKAKEWIGTEYEKYLVPKTLFGNKFNQYLNQDDSKSKNKEIPDSMWAN